MTEMVEAIEHVGEKHVHEIDYCTLQGHVIGGTIFATFGLLWTHNTLKRYQLARREALLNGKDSKKLNFKNLLWSKYTDMCAPHLPMEAFLVCGIGFLGMIGEFLSGFVGNGIFVWLVFHHMLSYMFYGLAGFTKLLLHYKVGLPPYADYAMFVIANLVEGYLFTGHLSAKTIVNAQFHMTLVYIAVATSACAVCEVFCKRSVLAALGRTVGFTFQGLWLIIMGFLIYTPSFLPKMDQDSHANLEIVTALSGLTLFIILINVAVMNSAITKKLKSLDIHSVNRILVMTYSPSHSPASKGDPEKPLISDSDYDD